MAECSIFNLVENNDKMILYKKLSDLLLADLLPDKENEELKDTRPNNYRW